MVFVLDQEDDELSVLSEMVRGKLGEVGIECVEGGRMSGRVMRYDCSLAGHGFRLVVVVNGLERPTGNAFFHKEPVWKLLVNFT